MKMSPSTNGNHARRLRRNYVLGLAIIATLTIFTQIYSQSNIRLQRDDAAIIDEAGRQRMLSQRIAKLAVMASLNNLEIDRAKLKDDLEASIQLFEQSNRELLLGSSKQDAATRSQVLQKMFEELQSIFDPFVLAAKRYASNFPEEQTSENDLHTILKYETEFLPKMHAVVGQLSDEAGARVQSLNYVAMTICCCVLAVLVLEALLVFEPAARQLALQFAKLEQVNERLTSEFMALNRAMGRVEFTNSGQIKDVNQKFIALSGRSKEELIGNFFCYLELTSPLSKGLSEWKPMKPGVVRSERYEWNSGDSTTRYVDAKFFPITDENGEVSRVVVYCVDVTKLCEAEREKVRVNAQLREASRKVGMAEVATGVIHNVGNVLNSANVAAHSLQRLINKLPTQRLSKIASRLFADPGTSGLDWLENNQKYSDYLVKMDGYLEDSQAKMKDEVDSISNCVGHIRDIIVMYQESSTQKDAFQQVLVGDLINEAVDLVKCVQQEENCKLRIELSENIKVTTSRHQVLQILVNLIRNAHQAAANSPRSPHVEIRAEAVDERWANITVSDNGVGITQKQMRKLFTFGYTTKEGGNGHGLHSSANLAKTMGGKLSAMSDGEDQGATFTLRLPLGQDLEPSDAADWDKSQGVLTLV